MAFQMGPVGEPQSGTGKWRGASFLKWVLSPYHHSRRYSIIKYRLDRRFQDTIREHMRSPGSLLFSPSHEFTSLGHCIRTIALAPSRQMDQKLIDERTSVLFIELISPALLWKKWMIDFFTFNIGHGDS